MKHALPIHAFHQSRGFCGPASLKMVLAYYGIHNTEQELARLSGTTRNFGVQAPGLLKAARALGFKAYKKDMATFDDIARLLKKKIPVIVEWFSETDGHYAVVVGLDKENIYLEDPEIGKMRAFRRDVFRRIWFACAYDWIRTKKDLLLRRMIVVLPPSPPMK